MAADYFSMLKSKVYFFVQLLYVWQIE